LDEADRVFVRTPLPMLRPIAAMKTRVWIRRGRLAEAAGWAQELEIKLTDTLSFIHEYEQVTLARLLISRCINRDSDTSDDETLDFLERLLSAAESGKRLRSVIEILILKAVVLEMSAGEESALKSIERALTLAESEGFIQIFVDEGPLVASLLYKAADRGVTPAFTKRLLAAFPENQVGQQADQSGLYEALSEREIEVLRLIGEGLSNEEVGARLFISPHTAKTHTRTIYAKLDVHNRTAAIARARAFGIV
jgi:LuxR family maltose regulon positive regulatory protein